jgi:putative membrane protein
MPSEHRLHPASMLFGLAAQLRQFAVPLLLLVVTAGSRGWDWPAWTLLLIVPNALVALARYVSFRYRYDPHELVFRSGVLFRSERHVPYARIQNLDAVQTLAHRLFGVVDVRVETGGGEEPEARLNVLPAAALDEMRRRVFEGAGGAGVAATGGAAAGAEPAVSPEGPTATASASRLVLHLPPRELMLFGIIQNRGILVVAAIVGVLWEGGLGETFSRWMFGSPVSPESAARTFARELAESGGISVGRIALGLAAFVVALIVVRVLSMLWALVKLHGFTLRRIGEDLRSEYGLLTRVTATIPLRRVQTLTIEEGPLHRLFGRASVRVSTAGGTGPAAVSVQREWLAPVVRRAELPRLVHEVLPELEAETLDWQPAHPRAFGREARVRSIKAFIVSAAMSPLLGWWSAALFASLAPIAIAGARLYVRHLGWALTDRDVAFRSGWARRRVTIARFVKIQAVSLHESPFDRRTGMARVRVDTAGASGATHRVDVPYLPRADAASLYGTLATEAAQTAFRW